ncbi:hypothetical protein F511_29564 [Dorcoceras hygrometricum]|uniref:Uncharacterized protein n=1 Tax=Dorcoceras hygrometricum TaxID=472368 RepID=A0A2Z7CMF2_9LAMI|nr:hypothetical protein F511_29564 [Dorcoceras hygrometricum]
MQYIYRAMHERATKNHRCDDSADHHKGSVVFRHNDSAGHHININININIGPFKHYDSAGRSQHPRQLSRSYSKLKSKAVKEQKSNYWSTIAKTLNHYSNFTFLKCGYSSLQTVLVTTKESKRGVSDQLLGLCDVVYVARASGNTALSSPCWDLLATMRSSG